MKLEQRMALQDNDYSAAEHTFYAQTNLQLVQNDIDVDPTPLVHAEVPLSVIVPSFNGGRVLHHLLTSLSRQTYQNFEVVIVDDGSEREVSETIHSVSNDLNFPMKVVRQRINHGRSYTRNTGITVSDGESLVFTDQDIVVAPNFLGHLAIRHAFISDGLFLGFKESIDMENLNSTLRADFKQDWRSSITVNEKFKPFELGKQMVDPEYREYRLLEETNNFKDLGHYALHGFWRLASMTSSHGMSVSKERALDINGFPEHGFDGWGFEDNAFGARLIAEGANVIPVLDAAYFHIRPETPGTLRTGKGPNNIRAYRKLLQSSLTDPIVPRHIEHISNTDNMQIYETD